MCEGQSLLGRELEIWRGGRCGARRDAAGHGDGRWVRRRVYVLRR